MKNIPKDITEFRIGVLGSSAHHRDIVCGLIGKGAVSLDASRLGFLAKAKTVRNYDYFIIMSDYKSLGYFTLLKFFSKKWAHYWIGTDVLNFRSEGSLRRAAFNYFCKNNIVVAEHLKKELSDFVNNLFVIPIVTDYKNIEVMALPEKTTVLAYGSSARKKFYGIDKIEVVAEHYPNVLFKIVGNFPKLNRNNIEYLGYVDIDSLWDDVTALVRPTEHDGLPKMVLEALARGRYVAYSYDFPFCDKGKTTKDITFFLETLKTIDKPNYQGSTFIKSTYKYTVIASELRSYVLNELGS